MNDKLTALEAAIFAQRYAASIEDGIEPVNAVFSACTSVLTFRNAVGVAAARCVDTAPVDAASARVRRLVMSIRYEQM
jgi:hypothetical protein